jgi:hypothetical protein
METTSGIVFAVEASIKTKLEAIGAVSKEKAATSQEAHFSMKEENWLDYIAGGMFARVKKTRDGRFYTAIYSNLSNIF